ncbi:MAG: glycosyltransferase family 2 protein [bacterium]
MKLSVIILNYNVSAFLDLCLRSVTEALTHIDSEIIVVDNNSTDDSIQMVKEYYADVQLIENPNNDGFAKGNNLGFTSAKGEYLCILNPDTVVAEDTFIKALAEADSVDKLGILGCKLIDGKGQFLPESKRNIPTPFISMMKMIGISSSYYASKLDVNKTGNIEINVGAFMLMKSSLYKSLQGFDEDFFMYGEDVDISYRVLKKGFKNWYSGIIKVVHFKGESTRKDKAYKERFFGAMQLFYKKHFKKNWLFDSLVSIAIKLASTKSVTIPTTSSSNKEVLLVSDNKYPELEELLSENVEYGRAVSADLPPSEIIFDVDYISFKEIIQFMDEVSNSQLYTFKFLLPHSKICLGSNDARTNGQVIKFG